MTRHFSDAMPVEEREKQITDWLTVLVEPGSVVELRALNVKRTNGYSSTYSGFYDSDHLADMARKAIALDRYADGVYFSLNPLHHDLLARRANRTDVAKKGESTSSEHVLRRRWLLIDCDPSRITGVSSTDGELELAERIAREVDAFLFENRWPKPIQAMSGNGAHRLFRIDLPANDDSLTLIKACLASVAWACSIDGVKIDTAVCDAPRICKLYGTWARKGSSTAERPHRLSQILDMPDELHVVSREQLEELAALMPSPPRLAKQSSSATAVVAQGATSAIVIQRARSYLAGGILAK